MRNIARLLVFVVAVAAVTLMAVVAVQVFANLPAGGEFSLGEGALPAFEGIRFDSPGDFYVSLMLSFRQADLDTPMDGGEGTASFVVNAGETASDVAQHLYEQGFITDPELFAQLMRYLGLDATLEAGEYALRRNMTPRQVAEALQHASAGGVIVTIPEGWRAEQVAFVIEQAGLVSAAAFMDAVQGGQYDYAWLADQPLGNSLEGLLFPDTYEFPKDATADQIVARLLENFDRKVTPEMVAAAGARGYTFYQVMILASIVERESVIAEERRVIASVYYNRLDVAYFEQAAGYLAADPTVQYAKGYDPATGNWWPPMALDDGQRVESPYNTFKYQGLPPGPICSPGLAAIEATLFPADTDYLYFFSKGDGSHAFASTLEEHLENQARYGYQP